MSSREMLFSAMLRAMKAPMYTMPFHCFSSVRRWLSHGSRIATGASTQKLKAMWPAATPARSSGDNQAAGSRGMLVQFMCPTCLQTHAAASTA